MAIQRRCVEGEARELKQAAISCDTSNICLLLLAVVLVCLSDTHSLTIVFLKQDVPNGAREETDRGASGASGLQGSFARSTKVPEPADSKDQKQGFNERVGHKDEKKSEGKGKRRGEGAIS
jgi:hypothetical protein